MSYRMEFEIPGLPPTTNSHGRVHWAIKAKTARDWKGWVRIQVGHCSEFGYRKAPLQKARLTLTRFSSNTPDADGLVSSFKHVIDGLVDAGVLVNDKMTNIGMPEYQWVKCKRGEGKIRVVVEEVSTDLVNKDCV